MPRIILTIGSEKYAIPFEVGPGHAWKFGQAVPVGLGYLGDGQLVYVIPSECVQADVDVVPDARVMSRALFDYLRQL